MWTLRLDSMRLRAAFLGMGLVGVAIWLVAGGPLVPKDEGTIAIEFGIDAEYFEGCEVEIDGETAGRLESFRALNRTAFRVASGSHTVRVLHPEHPSIAETVKVSTGATVLLLLDIQTVIGEQDRYETAIAFQ